MATPTATFDIQAFAPPFRELPPPPRDPEEPPTHEPPPEMCIYRGRVIALLRRYFRMSLEAGRLPSLVGRECFRARVSHYRMTTFEDVLIFVHDVERVLDSLDPFSKELIARVIFQEYTFSEAGRLLGYSFRTIRRAVPETLDLLAERFLELGLLIEAKKSCQGAGNGDSSPTAGKQTK